MRIRDAVGGSEDADASYRSVPRAYDRHGDSAPAALLELFEARLRDYGARVHRVPSGAVAEAMDAILRARGVPTILVPSGFPAEWLGGRCVEVLDDDLSYVNLDRVGAVVTTCVTAIAATGTIFLNHGPGQGRRALTLVPDFHICVIRAEQVVGVLPEALVRCGPGERLVTMISGPSATADIEMTRIAGVHGPRTLEVILVDG